MEQLKNYCKGCDCFNGKEQCNGHVKPAIKEDICPCLKCLLKMCCSISCPDFKEYSNIFIWKNIL